jgi:hypothetical protein
MLLCLFETNLLLSSKKICSLCYGKPNVCASAEYTSCQLHLSYCLNVYRNQGYVYRRVLKGKITMAVKVLGRYLLEG